MTTRTDAIDWVKQFLGRRDNDGAFMWPLAGMPQFVGSAWCGATVEATHRALGIETDWITPRYMIYVPAIVSSARNAGLWQPSRESKRGDLVCCDWQGHENSPSHNADHVCQVVDNNPRLSYVTTIDGNTSDGVHRNLQRGVFVRRRPRHMIMGTVDMSYAYDSKKHAGPAKPLPKGEIAVDGWFGPATARALGASDGVMSGQPVTLASNLWAVPCAEIVGHSEARGSRMVSRIQRAVGTDDDGFCGPHTIRAVQKKVGVKADGYMGHRTVRAMQKKVNSGDLI